MAEKLNGNMSGMDAIMMARTSVRTILSGMSGARPRKNPMNAAALSMTKRGHDSIDRRIKE